MKINADHLRKRILSMLLGLPMLISALLTTIPGMSLTVYADDPDPKAYADYDVTTDTNKIKTGNELVDLRVTFNGIPWYIIEDNSTAVDEGTVTLLAADPFAEMKFDLKDNEEDVLSDSYNDSKVKAYLDGLIDGTQTFDGSRSFKGVASGIKGTDLTTYAYNSTENVKETTENAKLYLLSVDEAQKVPQAVLNCGAWWWLRSPGNSQGTYIAALTVSPGGEANWISGGVDDREVWVRPALQLDLNSVVFFPETQTFGVPSYGGYVGKDDDTTDTLANKVVKFNGIDWYIIKDDSTAVDEGTVTLLAKDPIAASEFNDETKQDDHYSESKVKAYLDGLIDGTQTFGESKSFKAVSDAIRRVIVTTNESNSPFDYDTAPDVKLYLLSREEANDLPVNVRKCSQADGTSVNRWWLRSPGSIDNIVDSVDGEGGGISDSHVDNLYGVRPALNLDLTGVILASETKVFKTLATFKEYPKALPLTYNGNEQLLVKAGETEDGTFYYALGDGSLDAPVFDGDLENVDKKWSTDIPKASAVGTYYVWFMVKGDGSHFDDKPVCVTAEIKAPPAPPVSYYDVRFEMNGHGTAVEAQRIRSGETATKPEPAAKGYVFEGWYTDRECTKAYDFSEPVTESFTLYANWIEKNYTLDFDMQKHGEQIPAQSVPAGGIAEKPADPSEFGYSFDGWYTSLECKSEELYDFTTPVTADITLHAKWTEKVIPAVDYPLDPVPLIEDDTTTLNLVKGQIFIIGREWSIKKNDKATKALVSISSTGQLKAKKDGKATVWNGDRRLVLNISTPSVTKNLNLKITADGAESKAVELINPAGLPVCWFSASPDIVTVDEEGMVTAVSAGKAIVTAYINGRAYNCSVSVKESVPAKERTLHMAVGAAKSMSIKGVKNPVWSSADEEIASFEKKKLSANKAGETTLTAATADGTEYLVHLFVEDITLSGEGLVPQTNKKGKPIANKYTLTIKAGESTDLSFAAVDQAVFFKSSKPDIASIDENGKVTARAEGKSRFTAKVDGKTITINVLVE